MAFDHIIQLGIGDRRTMAMRCSQSEKHLWKRSITLCDHLRATCLWWCARHFLAYLPLQTDALDIQLTAFFFHGILIPPNVASLPFHSTLHFYFFSIHGHEMHSQLNWIISQYSQLLGISMCPECVYDVIVYCCCTMFCLRRSAVVDTEQTHT